MSRLPYIVGTKITRRDTTVEAYSSHDKDLTVDTVLYRSEASFTPSGVARSSDLKPDNIDLRGIIDGVYLTESALRAGEYLGARVEIIWINWETSTKVATLMVGFLGSFSIENSHYGIEFNSLESELGKPLGRVATLRCPWDLGDNDCGYSLSASSGTVTSQGSPTNRAFVDTARTEADGFWDGGKVTWTSGDNNGRTMDVKVFTASSDNVELYEPLPDVIEIGDGYDIYRGCDKQFSTCRDTFNNVIPATGKGFGGAPYLPGVSDVIGKRGE